MDDIAHRSTSQYVAKTQKAILSIFLFFLSFSVCVSVFFGNYYGICLLTRLVSAVNSLLLRHILHIRSPYTTCPSFCALLFAVVVLSTGDKLHILSHICECVAMSKNNRRKKEKNTYICFLSTPKCDSAAFRFIHHSNRIIYCRFIYIRARLNHHAKQTETNTKHTKKPIDFGFDRKFV